MQSHHFHGVIRLQSEAFPPPFDPKLLWKSSDLEVHLNKFPQGQWVALMDGDVVGSCSNTLLDEEHYQKHDDWETAVGGYSIETFSSGGTTLYGLDISVSERYRGFGIGRSFYQRRKALVRELRLQRYATGCRLPDFSASGIEDPNEYVRRVAEGQIQDRTLTPLLKYGLKIVGVHPSYMDDNESRNCAGLLEWTPEASIGGGAN